MADGNVSDDMDDAHKSLVFEARTVDGRRLTSMLASICLSSSSKATFDRAGGAGSSSPLAWCVVTDKGMEFIVNVANTLQAVAWVPGGEKGAIFDQYWLAPEYCARLGRPAAEQLEFGINLATLVECLKMCGTGGVGTSALHMKFDSSTECLALEIVEGISVTECTIHTLDIEAPARVELQTSGGVLPLRTLLRAETLKSGIDELEWGGDASSQKDKRVTLRAAPPPAALSLTLSAEDLGCEMVYPPESLISYAAAKEIEYDYRFRLLHLALRSLKESEHAELKVDEHGTLEINLRFYASHAGAESTLFSQFFIYPLAEDEDEVDATCFDDATAG